MAKQVRNAFCAVRPPGHHAGPCGLMSGPEAGAGAESHGFCLLNNISIGAAYALNVHRSVIKKVAIIDFDVHHGNGTEETIRWLNPGLSTVDVVSGGLFGQLHTPRYKPWLGTEDAQNVLFVSVHGYGPREKGYERFMPAAAFYPGTGKTCVPETVTPHPAPSASASSAPPHSAARPLASSSVVNPPQHKDTEDEEEQSGLFEEEGDGEQGSEDDSSFNGEGEGAGEEGEGESVDEAEAEAEAEAAEFLRSSAQPSPYSRLLHMHSFSAPSASCAPSASASASGCDSPPSSYAAPLVLDIGVTFAEEEMVQGEYRHQWRNYFREIIFPKLLEFQPDCLFISAGFDAHKKDLINSGYLSLVEEDYEWLTAQLMKIANGCCEGRIVSALEGGYQLGGEFSSAFAKSVKAHVSTLCSASASVRYDSLEAQREQQEERQVHPLPSLLC
jgi:acetoin utilization deacetylase AcuC-like enzyme